MELLRRLLGQYVMVQENAQRLVINAGYNFQVKQANRSHVN